ncbi:MAG: DNA translocase FtsK [Lachnospiraceae bacterium]|nr:DNA translocase FtsK [Lachnospiraceae bacterium]
MADKKKSSSGRPASGKNTKSGSGKNSSASRFSWESEVLLFVVLIICVVLFVANFGRAGAIGGALGSFFFGLFGAMSYIFPVGLFLLVAFLISNRFVGSNSKYHYPGRALVKALAGVFCFIFVCALCHIIYFGRETYRPLEAFRTCSMDKAGGGMVGSIFASGMIRGIGFAATVIISILILILCVILISERSLFSGLSKRYYTAMDNARDKAESEERSPKPSKRQKSASMKDDFEDNIEFALDDDMEDDLEFDMEDSYVREEKTPRRDRKATDVPINIDLAASRRENGIEPDDYGRMTEMDMSSFPFDDGFEEDEETAPVGGPTIHMSGHETSSAHTVNADQEDDTFKEAPPVKKTTAKKSKQTMQEVTAQVDDISQTISASSAVSHGNYTFPNIRLLKKGDPRKTGDSRTHLQQMSARLQETLETFGVNAKVTNVVCGPTVTQYEIQPEMGVKVSKILNLADDIKLNLMVSDIRIEAPIPGKAAIGIEVPNQQNVTVALRDLIESREFKESKSPISFCVGKDIAGHIIVSDIAKMPHLLIAGATGSGKSVCINTIIMSILYEASPEEVRLIMIDPKVVELSVYNNIPHLLIPVVTDPKKAAGALHWAVAEMTERYNLFAEYGVRDMEGYNKKVDSIQDIEGEDKPKRMANIVIIVDELADLMMVAASDVEDAICRLAQLARAAGIHLIIATQRPSVNVITGLIKANMPSRIAFSVTSGVDSRTILDMNGAEKLLGKGDMLFYPQGYAKPLRVQGAFVSDSEVAKVVSDVIAKNGQVSYNADIEDKVRSSESALGSGSGFTQSDDDRDVYFADAAYFLIEKEKGSIGMLQRNFKIGFNRAARIMDQLEEAGVVGPEEGTKPRRVLMTVEEFENLQEEQG